MHYAGISLEKIKGAKIVHSIPKIALQNFIDENGLYDLCTDEEFQSTLSERGDTILTPTDYLYLAINIFYHTSINNIYEMYECISEAEPIDYVTCILTDLMDLSKSTIIF